MINAYNQVVNCKDPSISDATRQNFITSPPVMSSDSKLDDKSEDEVAFAQDAKNIRCFDCGEIGHYKGSAECSKTTKSATQLLMTVRYEDGSNSDEIGWNMCNRGEVKTLKKTKTQGVLLVYRKVSTYWILLESESTVDIFKDKTLFKNVRKIKGEDI